MSWKVAGRIWVTGRGRLHHQSLTQSDLNKAAEEAVSHLSFRYVISGGSLPFVRGKSWNLLYFDGLERQCSAIGAIQRHSPANITVASVRRSGRLLKTIDKVAEIERWVAAIPPHALALSLPYALAVPLVAAAW